MSNEFIRRLDKAFDGASMAEVARRLKIPHATVRNYFQGRLPAPEVLIKIARETGISLNWLLAGIGEMYAVRNPPVDLGRLLEDKIAEIVEQKMAGRSHRSLPETVIDFDVEAAVLRLNEPQLVMSEWFRHEGRQYPTDYGVVFFQGWEGFSDEDKIAAVRDAKRVLDRTLGSG